MKGIMIGIPPSLEDAIVFIFKDRKFFLFSKLVVILIIGFMKSLLLDNLTMSHTLVRVYIVEIQYYKLIYSARMKVTR